MENITQPIDIINTAMLLGAIVIGLMHFDSLIYSNMAFIFGGFFLFICLLIGEYFYGCNIWGIVNILYLFESLKV